MKNLSFIHAALALLFSVFTAQNAAALTCLARAGDFNGDYAAQVFVNATTDACGYSPILGDSDLDGHYIASWDTQLQVLFFENGAAFGPASKSLSCGGADSTNPYTGGISAFFPSNVYTTTCSLSYTDPNGQTVSHSFGAHTELVLTLT